MLARNLMYEVSLNRVTIQPTVVAANYVPKAVSRASQDRPFVVNVLGAKTDLQIVSSCSLT